MKQQKKQEKKRNKITYWDEIELERKAIKARLEVEGATEEPIKKIVNLYNKVEKDINKDIQQIYDTYGKRTKETTEKVDEYLTNAEKNKEDKYLLNKINNASSETERKELVNIYNAQSAMYRMSRLESIKNNISIKLIGLAGEEEKINKEHYTKILVNKDNKFSTLKLKIQDEGAFNTVTKHMIDEVLEKKWYAKNYSDRIWENKDKLQEALDEILDKGLIQGKSMQKMAREFNEITHAGIYNATRLIRTESAYYHGQVTLKEYDELGVTKYKFTAKLDHRTSATCRKHDDKVYLVSEAKVGVNYPPMHPHCRSTTVPVIEENNDYNINKIVDEEKTKQKEKNIETEEIERPKPPEPHEKIKFTGEKRIKYLKDDTLEILNKDIINFKKEKIKNCDDLLNVIQKYDLDELFIKNMKVLEDQVYKYNGRDNFWVKNRYLYSEKESMYMFCDKTGYNRKPSILSKKEFGNLDNEEYIKVVRGLSDGAKTALEYKEQFKYGKNTYGFGGSVYGVGTYGSINISDTDYYGNVKMNLAISKKSEIINYDTIYKEQMKLRNEFESRKEELYKNYELKHVKTLEAITNNYNISAYAMMKGKDAIYIKDRNWYLILNRGIVFVEE